MKPFLSTTSLRTFTTAQAIETAQRLNYAGIEIWAEHLWARGEDAARLGALAAAGGLAVSLHGPSRDLNVTSANPGIRAESQRQYHRALEDAARLGARVVAFHPGAMSSVRDHAEEYWPVLIEVFRDLGDAAQRLGIILGIENMEERRGEFITNPSDVVRLVAGAQVASLGLTLDVAHLLFNGTPLDLAGIEAYVRHVHLSGSTKTLVHVPLDEAIYALTPPLRALAAFYMGAIAIEGYAEGREMASVEANRAAFDRLIASARVPA